jgi:hypothetical protein
VTRTPRAVLVFFACAFVVFTCVFPYNAAMNNPNENVRTYLTMAIVEHGTFAIDKIVERQGWVNDMAVAPDKHGVAHHYSVKGPAMGYLGVPVYWLFTKVAPVFKHRVPTATTPVPERAWWFRTTTLVLRMVIVQIPCFLFLVWFERWLRKTTRDTALRLITVAAVGFGTNYLAYSLMYVSHTLFGVTAFLSFALIYDERRRYPHDARRRRASRALLAGLLAGLASLLEYQAFPISVFLALYALATFWRPTRLAAFASGALLNAGLLMLYQWKCYDNPFTPGHKFTENPVFSQWHKTGFFGMTSPSWDVFKDLAVSRSYGFFGLSPFMWLGLLAIPFALVFTYGTPTERRNRRWATALWLTMIGVLWLAISAALNWRGGWTVGPRFFGVAPPFFGFGAACALEWIGRRGATMRALARGAAGGLLVASVLTIGFVSLVFNSIPEDVTRPLVQMAVPLARAGFVPHHIGELFGWTSPAAWYVICGLMFAATLLAAVLPAGERLRLLAARMVVVALFIFAGLKPAFSAPAPEEGGDAGLSMLHGFTHGWEPPGRDRLTTLREEAERYGPRRPCLWYKLADLERSVDWVADAARDEQRAGAPRESCH